MRWALVVAIGLLLASVLLAVSHAAPAAPIGQWLTQDRSGVIEIGPCGTSLCGRIVGMAEWPADGHVPVDVQGRPQCGLTIIADARPGSEDRWTGRITDPDTGHVYSAELWVDQGGQLHLRGYIGLPVFGATQVWTPYRAPVPKDCRLS